MGKKAFFRERTTAGVKELNRKKAYSQRELVRAIDSLDPTQDALEIRAQIIPGKFYRDVKDSAQASRKCFKHGDFIVSSHPETKKDCSKCSEIPLAIRARDFSILGEMKEEEVNFVGYSIQPSWGDRIKRIFPFVFMPEGVRIFTYAETRTKGIEIEPYSDALKVASEGTSVVVQVPSRTQRQERYKFKLLHIPMVRSLDNLATVLTLRPALLQDRETGEFKRGVTAHEQYNIRYVWEEEREASNVITFYPQVVAAYIKIAGEGWKQHNLTTMKFNPFALTSRHGAEFYFKLENNVLIYDSSIETKDKLRRLHLAEKSILWARAIGRFGHDDIAYWDPARDGKLRDYDWEMRK